MRARIVLIHHTKSQENGEKKGRGGEDVELLDRPRNLHREQWPHMLQHLKRVLLQGN